MIFLIFGASHTGKTVLAQRILEKHKYPYLSIDHLKMGLIRSGNTTLKPQSNDEQLTKYLWPIVREMIKTAIENNQNLIVEGCYIPFAWKKDFSAEYLSEIKGYCLIMSEKYIRENFEQIKAHANDIENRLDDSCCSKDLLIKENLYNLKMCEKHDCEYILIDEKYEEIYDLV